ncbi:MAG: DUF4234 domain-containing protein [Saccharospirillaceae bacterium]|nr:DUF4234 domain-containing protein [Pseudomonadales bacterium]NRB78676.1 DUF4234 domain-containing protein [Saccharospirillaceae bacterium]
MTNNLYAAPESDLNQEVDANGDDAILEFTRFSAWGVFGLSFITLGIYMYFWLYKNISTVNRLHDQPVSLNLLWAYLGLNLVGTIMPYLGSPLLASLSMLFSLAGFILLLVMAYTLRSRLTDIIKRSGLENLPKIGGVMTFFFNVLYFQYKINQAIDAKNGKSEA